MPNFKIGLNIEVRHDDPITDEPHVFRGRIEVIHGQTVTIVLDPKIPDGPEKVVFKKLRYNDPRVTIFP